MEILMVAALVTAAAIDFKKRKIPNWLTGSLAVSGIIFHFINSGISGLELSVLGFLTGTALLFLPFAMGGMGGGDVKLLAAIGSFSGPALIVHIFLASAIAGGIFSLIEVARRGAWQSAFAGMRDRLLFLTLTHKLPSEGSVRFAAQKIHIPYAISIAAGYLWTYYFGGMS